MIIGLDLSLTHTGWVVISKEKIVGFGTIIPGKLRGVKRLSYIRRNLLKIIKEFDDIELAILEGYAYSPNANMAFSIGENGGVVKLMLYKYGIDCISVAPKTLKKFAADSGNASKKKMEKMVLRKWNKKFETDHEVDAYALAKMGLYIKQGTWKYLKNTEKEAIKTVIKDVSKKNENGRKR